MLQPVLQEDGTYECVDKPAVSPGTDSSSAASDDVSDSTHGHMVDSLVDFMGTLVPGMTMSDELPDSQSHEELPPKLPPKQKSRSPEPVLVTVPNGRVAGSDGNAAMSSPVPAVPPRRRDHKRQTPPVSLQAFLLQHCLHFSMITVIQCFKIINWGLN